MLRTSFLKNITINSIKINLLCLNWNKRKILNKLHPSGLKGEKLINIYFTFPPKCNKKRIPNYYKSVKDVSPKSLAMKGVKFLLNLQCMNTRMYQNGAEV